MCIRDSYYNNHEFREEFEGEYTECGIKFEVSSFCLLYTSLHPTCGVLTIENGRADVSTLRL